MRHLMLDIETLGQGPYSVVLSVGAVAFDKDKIISHKEWFLNVEEQIRQGRRIDYDTVKWWMKQSDEARQIFQTTMISSLIYFCKELTTFFDFNCGPDGRIWGNGASFDIPIIETLYLKTMNDTLPWKFWHHRCYRTVKAQFGIEKGVVFEGVKHGALSDSMHQAKCLQKLFQQRPELDV